MAAPAPQPVALPARARPARLAEPALAQAGRVRGPGALAVTVARLAAPQAVARVLVEQQVAAPAAEQRVAAPAVAATEAVAVADRVTWRDPLACPTARAVASQP